VRHDSDFVDGRWLPPWDRGASHNFAFVTDERMARVARVAEANLHIDPNTTLMKLRQFGELLARDAAPTCGTHPWPGESQVDLLARLRGPRGLDREILDALHELRTRGNEAVHSHAGDKRDAVRALKTAQRLAWWFEVHVQGRQVARPKFAVPDDPREAFAAAGKTYQEAQKRASRLAEEAEAKEAEARDAIEAARVTEVALEAVRRERARLEEEAATWRELAEEAASDPASLAHRLEALKRDLALIQGTASDGPGLPDWVAAVIAGDDPPVELPEELIQDLRALAGILPVPPMRTPDVIVESTGNLASKARVPLQIQPAIRHPETLEGAARSGAVWVDDAGNEFLVPQGLRIALDALAQGPPTAEPGEKPADTTKRRRLWWGRLRRDLEAFGVDLRGYLGATDAVVVDRLRPRLVIRDDGQFEVRFACDQLTEDDTTRLIDDADLRGERNPTVRHRDDDGVRHRRTVILSETGRRAMRRARQVRQRGQDAAPFLRDALESVFDPELFDLSEYSDRVVGIGRPVYRVSPSMIDGDQEHRFRLTPSADSDDEPPLVLDPAEQAELAALLKGAAERGLAYVPFRGAWVRVPTRERAAELVEATGPVRSGGVLIIDENIEGIGFAPADQGGGGRASVPRRPPGLADDVNLMPHQLDGVSWLAGHAALVPGASDHGLLADDMGLGKTLQVLALMSLLEDKGQLRPALVVAPLSLLDNWEREAQRFFPGRFPRRVRLGRGVKYNAEVLRQYDVVFASYETVRSQQLELGRVRWALMVCDECHRIRNPTALTSRAVLAMDAERRIGLTGTPVQNSLIDLWSQFDWLAPGVLGDLAGFKRKFARVDDEQAPSVASLRRTVSERVLRRLKRVVVADLLPTKTTHRPPLPMDEAQSDLYQQLLKEFRGQRGRAFKILPRLLQVVAEPSLVAAMSPPSPGPKLRWLLEKLEEIKRRGEKAVVFAEWYALQEQVAAAIEGRFQIPVDRINGKVQAGLRLAKLDAFQRAPGFGVLVLGPKATGVGLNITAANHVVHLTRHWNPALEAQATDRVYRIGQDRPVHVYLPLVVHPDFQTIDEHLDALLGAKEELAQDFLTGLNDLSVSRELEAVMMGGGA